MPTEFTIDSSPVRINTQAVIVGPTVVSQLETLLLDGIGSGQFIDARPVIELLHHFIPGGYAREMRVKAGVLLTGSVHKNACFNVVLTGSLSVVNGGEKVLISAPAFFVSPAGSQRAMLVHQDAIWITVHPCAATDVVGAEAELIYDNSKLAGN